MSTEDSPNERAAESFDSRCFDSRCFDSRSAGSTESKINGVLIDDTFAEAFDMVATRLIITAHDEIWCQHAADALTGFGTSVIACGIEIDVERALSGNETPDGRCGLAILAFAANSKELAKQIPRRVGQCVLTCPSTAIYGGVEQSGAGDGQRANEGYAVDSSKERIGLGKTLRYFGDGHQISKVLDGVRHWRIPVMDGEFVCEHDVPRFSGIGGGNFLLCGDSMESVTIACRAAVAAIAPLHGVITPFPGGATRSGSKVGSKYAALFASTNEAYCPALKHLPGNELEPATAAVLEVVIDGVDYESIATATRVGIAAAADAGGGNGLHRITAGNYGGKLGKHHFHLRKLFGEYTSQ